MVPGGTDLGALVVRLQAETAQFHRALATAEVSAKRTSGNLVGMFAKAATGMGLALTGVSAIAVRQYGEFEHAMTESTAIMMGLNKQLQDEMAQTARELGTKGIQSATELAEAYFFLASAGLDARQSMAALPMVQKFATAGAFNLSKATDLLTDAQSALGLTVKDATQNMENMGRIADVLVKANTLANASVEQFSISLTTKAGAALRLLNKDIEEGVAVLAAFADQGIKAQDAGTQLSIVLRDLQRANISNRESFDALGVSVYDSEGNMRNMADIIGNLEMVFAGMSDEALRTSLMLLGLNDRSIQATASLFGMSDKIRTYERELRNAGGTTETVANKQLQSFNNQLKLVGSLFSELFIEFGSRLVPMLRLVTDQFLKAGESTEEFRKKSELLSDTLVTGVLHSVGAVSDAVYGWIGISKTATYSLLWMATQVSEAFDFLANSIAVVIKGIEVGFKTVRIPIEQAMSGILKSIQVAVNGAIKSLNWLIDQANRIPGIKVERIMPMDFAEGSKEYLADLKAELETAQDELRALWHAGLSEDTLILQESLAAVGKELEDMAEKGKPSERLLEKYVELAAQFRSELDKATKTDALAAFSEIFGKGMNSGVSLVDQKQWAGGNVLAGAGRFRNFDLEFGEAAGLSHAEIRAEAQKQSRALMVQKQLDAINSVGVEFQAPSREIEAFGFGEDRRGWQEYERAAASIDAFSFPKQEPMARREFGRLGAFGGVNELEKQGTDYGKMQGQVVLEQMAELETAYAAAQAAASGHYEHLLQINEEFHRQNRELEEEWNESLKLFHTESDAEAIAERLRVMEDYYDRLESAAEGNAERILEIEAARERARRELIEESTILALTTVAGGMNQMLAVMQQAGMEQKGIYKAMFAVTKAAAIAVSIVELKKAIITAKGSLPFPANLVAAAQVAAAGAGLIANIMSAALSFEGGGKTPDGARTGGVDGRGGFYAILHPQEEVIDHYKRRTAPSFEGGGFVGANGLISRSVDNERPAGGLNINIQNNAPVKVEARRSTAGDVEVLINQLDQRFADNVMSGRGALPRAFERAYAGARRAQ